MKYLSALFFIFVIAVIVLADSGSLPHSIRAIYDFPNGDKVGHFILFGLLNFFLTSAFLSSQPNPRRKLAAVSTGLILALCIAFEEWSHRKFGKSDFDPTLWMIAWDGDQIAGYSQNRFRMGIGWIGTLGVRRPWRKMGLGLALLQYSFGEFYKRGTTTIGLGVDASNPTGATRLYQRAGMYVASEFATYEKELRAGRSLE